MRSLRRPWLAILPALLLLVAAALPLGGCCGGPTNDPQLVLRSPLWPQVTPVPQARGYAIAVPEARRYEELREYSAPAPAYRYEPLPRARAVGPCADPGTAPYSPPPIPGDDDVPESIPALRH